MLYVYIAYFNFRLDVALDLEILATERYTGSYFFEEARGLADAAGIDYKVNCHILQEFVEITI